MFKIVSILSVIASACASASVATLGASIYGAPILSAHSVVAPVLAAKHVTYARPAAVAVERVHYGSVPSVSVVNEPTSIVTPGRPIKGHSYTSEVRHDTVARLAAPVYASYAAPVVAAAPAVLAAPVHVPAPVHTLTSDVVLPTGPAQIIAAPASVKGYTLETGRTELVNEVRLRTAHIPTTVLQDTYVHSAPAVAPALYSEPLVLKSGLLGPLWKK